MRSNRFYFFSILLCCIGFNSLLSAQNVYVNDTLRVGVRTEPGNQTAPIYVVTTGMQLQILEEGGDFVKIRTQNGVEGWVKASYVSAQAPAIMQLKQLKEKHQDLLTKISKQQALVQSGEKNSASLAAELGQLKAANTRLRQQLAEHEDKAMQSAFGYIWKILLVLIICVVGFSIGVTWHRNRAMKRLGGLRV